MALARNLRTLIVLGTVASLMVTGAIWAHQAVAQDAPECPPDWPNQQYAGPLREKDHGRIQYQDYHTDFDGERWFVIRASDSNGYTTIRAYPASDDADGGYQADSPDQVCYLIVRKPGAAEDATEPDQVEFPREQEEQTSGSGSVSTPAPTPEQSTTPQPPATPGPTPSATPASNAAPTLDLLEFDGETVASGPVSRGGFERGQEIPIKLRGQDVDGNLAHIALVAQDGTPLDRGDCAVAADQECVLTLAVTTTDLDGSTLRFRAVAVDDAGVQSDAIAFAITTRRPPGSSTTPPRPRPTPRPMVSQQITAGSEATVQHPSGVQVEVPEGATAHLTQDGYVWSPGPGTDEGSTLETNGMVTITIVEADPPAESVLGVGQVYDISITDDDGDDVRLGEPVTVTLPYTLSEGKQTSDLVVMHWDDQLGRWEEVEGSVVDEEEGTITVRIDQLSDVCLAEYLNPMEFIATSALSLVGETVLRQSYSAGFKHLISLRVEEGFRPPILPIFELGKVGVSAVFDVDDLASLPVIQNSPVGQLLMSRPITREGAGHFITSWLNGHAELSVEGGVSSPFKIIFSVLNTGEYGTTGYNTDPDFSASVAPVSVTLPGGVEFQAKVNENGNISPKDAQLNTCVTCPLDLSAEVSFAEVTFNILKGELNTQDLYQALAAMLDPANSETCSQEDSDNTLPDKNDPGGKVSLEFFNAELMCTIFKSVGSAIETVVDEAFYEFTEYENTSPAAVAMLDPSLFNRVVGATGGYDVNLDGTGELIFPPHDVDNNRLTLLPLEMSITGDRDESRSYFLELRSVTDGWDVQLNQDPAVWNSGMNPVFNEDPLLSDALRRVEFDALALSAYSTHWLVTADTDAPATGNADFWLVHDKLVDEVVATATLDLVKSQPYADLTIEATGQHAFSIDGETLAYTVQVANLGPSPASGIRVHALNTVGDGLRLTGASTPGNSRLCGDTPRFRGVNCSLDDLQADESVELTLEFDLGVSLDPGQPIRMAFAVETGSRDLTPQNNSTVAVVTRNTSEREILTAFYAAAGGSSWTNDLNWGSNLPLDDWHGVEIYDGRVVALDLADNGLSGDIPVQVGYLTHLERLDLHGNDLPGEIPEELGYLKRLKILDLKENQLTGTIPAALGHLTNLELLSLGHNTELTGPIPEELLNLTKLKVLSLRSSALTGEIPSVLARLTRLEQLHLNDNKLAGEIPTALGSLDKLQNVYLSGDDHVIIGCIPPDLGDVPNNDLGQLRLPDCGSTPFALDPALQFPAEVLDAAGNDAPWGIWSDHTTMWVADSDDKKIYAYNLETKERDADKDFNTLDAAGNDNPRGIWSDGTTMWVADDPTLTPGRIYAYNMDDRERNSGLDFAATMDAAGNRNPAGIWSDESTMWVADWVENKIYAYNMADKSREFTSDINDLDDDAQNLEPTGIWSDRRTMWVADDPLLGSGKIYAYNLRDGERVSRLEFQTLAGAGNTDPSGIWSNGAIMWVADRDDGKIYAYNMPTFTGIQADRAALTALYHATGGPSWRNDANWLSATDLAEWHGVTTDADGRVTELHLGDNYMRGEIPEELAQLTNLTFLDLGLNDLTGEIPEELAQLTNLTFLDLGSNDLTGEIPEELAQLTNLTVLELHSNRGPNYTGLTGEIPEELAQLTNLTFLDLSNNYLTGEIPEELGQLTNLTHLYLHANGDLGFNGLIGEIPEELAQLTNLTTLSLWYNDLTGEIPEELGQLSNLTRLDLSSNDLTGEIPEELGQLTNLTFLSLYGNDFTGCIPTGLRYVGNGGLALPFCDETASAPVITSDYSFTVPEGTTAVGTLTATDQDTAGNLLV